MPRHNVRLLEYMLWPHMNRERVYTSARNSSRLSLSFAVGDVN